MEVTEGESFGNGAKRTPKKSEGKCKKGNCCSRIADIFCSNFGVCLMVVLYTVAGAFLFSNIEGGEDESGMLVVGPSIQQVTEEAGATTVDSEKAAAVIEKTMVKMRQDTVERLWTITESLNILYRANWTRVAEKELERFSEHLLTQAKTYDQAAASRDAKVTQPYRWSFAGSLLYSLTLITTIGYGAVAPQTGLGRIVTMVYALLGIPLMLLYLSSVGDLLARFLKWIWSKVCCRCRRKRVPKTPSGPAVGRGNLVPNTYHHLDPRNLGKWNEFPEDYLESDVGAVPVTLCLIIMVAYMCGGAAVFSYTHGWPFLHSIFFCFSSLTTIGFGDLSPGVGVRSFISLQLSQIASAVYLLVGMGLIATCFNLMQEQVTSRNGLSRKLGGMLEAGGSHHRFHLSET